MAPKLVRIVGVSKVKNTLEILLYNAKVVANLRNEDAFLVSPNKN